MFRFNSKNETIDILKKYFQQFNPNELVYYLDNNNKIPIPQFLESNIYDPEDIELKNLFIEHFKIAYEKVFYLTTPLNISRSPINFSFITNSIYWSDLFVISNTIFISYSYLIKIFDKIENNNYTSISDIYIKENKIFDLDFLKKIAQCLFCIIQYLNFDYWEDFICDKYNCCFIEESEIKFKNKYKILQDPNYSFIQNKLTVYWLNSGKIYTVINSICSNLSYSPYWEKKIIELKYNNGIYEEVDNNTKQIKINFESNPFESKAKQMTNCIIHNK